MKRPFMSAKILFFLIVTFFVTHIGNAQNRRAITNSDIVKLVKSGVDTEIIITTIEAGKGNYDLTDKALIVLRTAKTPATVINAMENKMKKPNEKKEIQENYPNTTVQNSHSGTPTPDALNTVFHYNKATNNLQSLEKSRGVLKFRSKALGYGGSKEMCEISGDESPVRMASAESMSFIINTGGGTSDAIKLYKLDHNKKSRWATFSKVSLLAGMSGAEGNIPCQIRMLKQGIFEIIPESKLSEGEYFFTTKAADYNSSVNLEVFAFGID